MADDPVPLDRYRLHADICKVLTDPKRLLLLAALRNGDRTVGELAATIGTSLANASQHLAVLRSAGLVDGRREGAILDACDIVDRIVECRLARQAAGRPSATANSANSANSAPAAPAG
jgi:DNA-binding transcriptional ArsR family regulator